MKFLVLFTTQGKLLDPKIKHFAREGDLPRPMPNFGRPKNDLKLEKALANPWQMIFNDPFLTLSSVLDTGHGFMGSGGRSGSISVF